ncbi:MAG: AMP phosphorylase [Candidatus Heimdallarchaeota archaeon]|nr:AMP phosphorylase [Candidatus Heimdallarchaeota archaeon]
MKLILISKSKRICIAYTKQNLQITQKEKYRLLDLELTIKPLDIEAGGKYIVVLNEAWSHQKGIYAGDRVQILKGKHKLIGIVDTSDTSIKPYEIGIFEEIETAYGFKAGEKVRIRRVEETTSPKLIKEKLDGKKLSFEEIQTIVKDIVTRRLSASEISAFAVSTYTRDWSMDEIADLTISMVETGEQLEWTKHPIANKHCLGGVPGNRTTLLVVPTIAAAGVAIPKTSSRAITSPAGTADTMEVFAKVEFRSNELQKIVNEINCCIAWGGAVDLAPADSAMIKVLNPLRLDPVPMTISSIMAKKKASGTTDLIIDIPYGKETKVPTKTEAKELSKKFEKIGRNLEINIKVLITEGSEPIGNGIGPILEARDVLKVLERREDRPKDLEEKSLKLCGELLKLIGKGDYKKAKEILESKQALEKFKEIIKAQKGNPKISVEDLQLARYTKEITATKSGKIKTINNFYITEIARRLGCPGLKDCGVFIHHHVGETVEKGQKLLTLHAKSKEELSETVSYLSNNEPIKIN